MPGSGLQSAVASIIGALNKLRFASAPIDDIYADLTAIEALDLREVVEPLPFERELAVEHVTFRYPNAHRNALDDVSLVSSRASSSACAAPPVAARRR
jgi:hypothetical protein